MVLNPSIPLDIFLPPNDFSNVHILGTKDQNGFNAGMFFIRAHKWSINLLASTMALDGTNTEVAAGFAEQTALYLMFNETIRHEHVLYQPRKWFNTYEFSFAYEGEPGNLFVHFVGLQEDRWGRMVKWLEILDSPEQEQWNIPLAQTKYPEDIEDFWSTVRDGKAAMAVELGHEKLSAAGLPENVRAAHDRLEYMLWSETDQPEAVRNATKELRTVVMKSPGFAKAAAS